MTRLCILLGLLVGTQPSLAAHRKLPTDTCNTVFKAVDFRSYIEVLAKHEIGPKSLQAAEKKITDYFSRLPLNPLLIVDIDVPSGNVIAQKNQTNIRKLVTHFSGVVSAYVRGMDEMADQTIEDFMNVFDDAGLPRMDATSLRQVARRAARDPDIYKSFTMAEFIMRRKPSVEVYFAMLQFPQFVNVNLPFTVEDYPGLFTAGPRQAEMVRVALQYTVTKPDDRILEIGYGNPSVLLGLAFYTEIKNMTGVDLVPVAPGSNEFLQSQGIELLQGSFPDDAKAMAQLYGRGPYSVILGLDTIKLDAKILRTSTSPAEYAKHLYNLLDTQGAVVIMNDYEDRPYFTQQQAEEAGFQIVTWGQVREMPKEIKAFMPYDRMNKAAGSFAVYVLRKGGLRKDNIRMVVSKR